MRNLLSRITCNGDGMKKDYTMSWVYAVCPADQGLPAACQPHMFCRVSFSHAYITETHTEALRHCGTEAQKPQGHRSCRNMGFRTRACHDRFWGARVVSIWIYSNIPSASNFWNPLDCTKHRHVSDWTDPICNKRNVSVYPALWAHGTKCSGAGFIKGRLRPPPMEIEITKPLQLLLAKGA